MTRGKRATTSGETLPRGPSEDVDRDTSIGEREGGLTRRFRGLFREIQREVDEMEARMERLQEDLWTRAGTAPLLYGWTIERGKGGIPRFRSFGNIDRTLNELEEGWRRPLISWHYDETDEEVIVEAEVPGVKKEDVHVEVADNEVEIAAETDDRKYRGAIKVPYELDPKTAVARHEDGVIRLTVKPTSVEERPKRIEIPVA